MEIINKNRFRTDSWKDDSLKSVDLYNEWFMTSAPEAYKAARKGVMDKVKRVFRLSSNLTCITSDLVIDNPSYISVLRACTAPPLASDRLVGLSYTKKSLLKRLEDGKLPSQMDSVELRASIEKLLSVVSQLLDSDLMSWIRDNHEPTSQAVNRCCAVISDRITGSLADPIIRNSQEQRQFVAIDSYLKENGYSLINAKEIKSIDSMPQKTYAHHMNIPVHHNGETKMPIDVVIQPYYEGKSHFPILVECKSAGDFLNTNKRRKEEATKMQQLVNSYGRENITFILFLCGYFDVGYLGYEASEGIDWVWEHRISDFKHFGV